MPVQKGDTVTVEYTGTLADGTVFDSSEKHGKPLTFTVGAGEVIAGFDSAVVGMEQGQEKEVSVPPEQGYGEVRKELLQQVPTESLPDGSEEGMMLAVGMPGGQTVPARIAEMSEATSTIDFNHPLAGKTLHFRIKVTESA